MKKTLQMIAAALVLATATVAQAQGGGGGGGGGGNMQDRMAQQRAKMFEGITLTAAQNTKIDSISATARKAQMELMAGMQQGGQMTPEMREKRMALTTKERADIKALLTKEQAEQFDKNIAAMGNGRRG